MENVVSSRAELQKQECVTFPSGDIIETILII